RERRAAHLDECPAPLEADDDVNAARSGGLGPSGEPEVVKGGTHNAGDLLQLWPLDAWNRIEGHTQFVGMIEIVRAHGMRMELEAGEVGHPRERGGIARHDFLGG